MKRSKEAKEMLSELWTRVLMPAVPFIANLRVAILNAPEPPKRMPKWRLKLGEDLGVEMQPKDSSRVLFQCRALEGPGLGAESFTGKCERGSMLRQLSFRIILNGGEWHFGAHSCQYSADDNVRHLVDEKGRMIQEPFGALEARRNAAIAKLIDLRVRILSELTPEFCADGITLLSQNCLICGHALKDPVSKMRLIGPECYGKAGVNAPILIREPGQSAGAVVERRYGLRLTEACEEMLSGSAPDRAA
jgi:hypothetical protein